jgi:hypothetical protein
MKEQWARHVARMEKIKKWVQDFGIEIRKEATSWKT